MEMRRGASVTATSGRGVGEAAGRAWIAIGTYLLLPALALDAGRSIIARLAKDNIGTHGGLARWFLGMGRAARDISERGKEISGERREEEQRHAAAAASKQRTAPI